MSDPNGFSIYISDRERERLERERRAAQKPVVPKEAVSTSTAITTALPAQPLTTEHIAPKFIGIPSKFASVIDAEVENDEDSAEEVLDDEEIERRLNAAPIPIVSVSNITTDDTPHRLKDLRAFQKFSICDKCQNCPCYEKATNSDQCICGCDLIFHLKDGEQHLGEEDEEDEEEWEDDDYDDDNDGNDDPDGDLPVASSSQSVDVADIEDKEDQFDEEYAEGGED